MADPYIRVWDKENSNLKTAVRNNNLNPIFYEAKDFYYDVYVDKSKTKQNQIADENLGYLIDNFPPIVLDCLDKDKGLTTISDTS